MAMAARLARLHRTNQPDLEALPDRPLPEPIPSDSDASGGVALANYTHTQQQTYQTASQHSQHTQHT